MKKDSQQYNIIKINEPKDGIISVEAEITADAIHQYRSQALKDIQKNFQKQGFRKGNVPLNIIQEHVKESDILEDAARDAIQNVLPAVMNEISEPTIGMPEVTITKLAPDNPATFTIRIATKPKFKLPKYKKVAEKIMSEASEEDFEVSEKDVQGVINNIRMMQAQAGNSEDSDSEDGFPELTDEYVQKLGDFENIADFKEKIKENIRREKLAGAQQRTRDKIAEALVEKTNITVPQTLIDSELKVLAENLAKDLKKQGMEPREYFEQMNTSREEFFEKQKGHIDRQFKTRFILEKIAEEEELEATDEELQMYTEMYAHRHPDADPIALKNYLRSLIVNEKVLRLLEGKDVDLLQNEENKKANGEASTE